MNGEVQHMSPERGKQNLIISHPHKVYYLKVKCTISMQ